MVTKFVTPLEGTDAVVPKQNGFTRIDSYQYGPYRYRFNEREDFIYEVLYNGRWYQYDIETKAERDETARAGIASGEFTLSPIQE